MKKILIIDDSKTQLNTLKILLKKEGFEVETAIDGAEGFNKTCKFVPDLILSDVLMPNINGYQLSRLIKNSQFLKKIPIILLTAFDEKINKFWSLKAGAQKYLLKNIDFTEIKKACNEIISQYPVDEQTKNEIFHLSSSNQTPQSQINTIIDDALIQQTIINEFRESAKFIDNEKLFVTNLFELLSLIIKFKYCYISFNNQANDEQKIVYINSYGKSEKFDDFIKDNLPFENYSLEKISLKNFDTKEIDNLSFNFTNIQIKNENEYLNHIGFVFDNDSLENKFMDLILEELKLLFKIKNLYDTNKRLSIKDTLTGLDNRRSFEEHIDREFSRALRYKLPISVAMIDIDFFKNINDSYGHDAGDLILKEFASILLQVYRKTDLIFRIGGEEILIILPQTSKINAFVPLERLRKKIEEYIFNYNEQQIKMTISIGIADNFGVDHKDELVKNADIALYEAKNSGKNKVVIFDGK